ncbi:pitrilysin family protein [Phenylobacterium sp.]|uniref:M16 family metallopeptidase n=1 Tax=Phenylobacterium sp. TaxID=1871053 RepID=UPI002733EFD6|nr:M16 family metallopeptidase [Phenylobacterium sp.]MDP3660582.1 insulinase family protein [Phenylobacterium sp.]
MNRAFRASFALAAALSLACAAPSASSFSLPKFKLPGLGAKEAPKAAPTSEKLKPGEWPQARSDVQVDPSIRFGALPNGMRYAIQKQSIPAGQASLRLRFAAGSLMETDAQQGLAHFLEHMAFNGSKAVPEGDMVKILERLGLAFGADTNASTDFEQTLYKLDLPHTDAETVDTSLMLMRQTAGELTIEPGAVDRERGVVLSEERARDTPGYRIYRSRLDFFLQGQRPPNRFPIGKVEVLKDAPASQIAAFYNNYYRPERAVLVAVGDFDVDAMEAKIRTKFSDWTARGPAGAEPDVGPVKPRGAEARLVIEPGAPTSIQVAWIAPPDLSADTGAKRRHDLVEQLGFSVLNRRLSRLSRGAEPPFLGAAAFKGDDYKAAEVTMLTVNAEPGGWKTALAAVEQEQRRAVQFGVRQDELDREVEEIRTSLTAAVAGAATRRQTQLAAEIVDSLDDDTVVTDPAQDLAMFESAVKDLKAEQVSAALKGAFKGSGPLTFMASPTPIEGGEAALLAALQESQKVAVTSPAEPSEVTWPYASFGNPGKVVEEREVADLDTVFVRFANGVRLTIKPTRFRDDEILIRVRVGGGLTDIPKSRENAGWASGAFTEGGLKQISAEDMERVLASKVFAARFGVGDDAFTLSGGTRPDDLDVQLQVLSAYLAEPGWRPEAFQRLKGAGKTIHDQYEATDSGVLARDLPALLHPGDQRWVFPSREQIAGAKLEDLQAQVTPALKDGPIEVIIVGDTTVEKATAAVAATLGALPARREPARPDPAQLQIGFPKADAAPLVLRHKGRADQAIGYVAWPTTDFFADPQKARETAVMGEIMELRLIDELREAQGATYSPSVNYNHSFVWPGWGYLAASVEVPPAKLDSFFADVRRIGHELADKGTTPDELERAKKPRLDNIEKARVTNQYWLSELSGAQADPRRLDAIRAAIPGTERVTAADVQRAAKTYLRDDKAWMLAVRPQKE